MPLPKKDRWAPRPPATHVDEEQGRARDDASGALDIERVTEEASRFAAGAFGYLLWVDAYCIERGLHALSPWWLWSTGSFYATDKRWGIFCVGRGGGKSVSLERVAASECLFTPRVVPPGQTWAWPFISVSIADATRRLRGIAAVYRALGLRVIGEYDGGEKVKDGIKMSLASPAHMDLSDVRNNLIQLLSIAGTVGNVSGPSTIGATIDEAAKLLDRAENANPLTEIFASTTQTFRARKGPRAFMCSSPLGRTGLHFHLVDQGDTETNFVARIGSAFLDDAKRGFEQVAAWEQQRGDARAAAEIRTHAGSLTAESPYIPTWVANPTLGNPVQGEPWEWAAMASRRELEALPENQLEGLPKWAFWLRECGALPTNSDGACDGRQFHGLAEANAMLGRALRGADTPSLTLAPQKVPGAPLGDARYAGPSPLGPVSALGSRRIF